ncbi:MAG TPA: PDZ domain-containing protein, partial [Planctomycetota bacterium]|nr:PDZ domain-containing protein [Planctomycetota bacterium]
VRLVRVQTDEGQTPPPKTLPAKPRPYLGIELGAGSDGLTISKVREGTGAAEAGLQKGDRVIRLAETKVASAAELVDAIVHRKVGEQVAIAVERDGQEVVLLATLGIRPDPAILGERAILAERIAPEARVDEAIEVPQGMEWEALESPEGVEWVLPDGVVLDAPEMDPAEPRPERIRVVMPDGEEGPHFRFFGRAEDRDEHSDEDDDDDDGPMRHRQGFGAKILIERIGADGQVHRREWSSEGGPKQGLQGEKKREKKRAMKQGKRRGMERGPASKPMVCPKCGCACRPEPRPRQGLLERLRSRLGGQRGMRRGGEEMAPRLRMQRGPGRAPQMRGEPGRPQGMQPGEGRPHRMRPPMERGQAGPGPGGDLEQLRAEVRELHEQIQQLRDELAKQDRPEPRPRKPRGER